MILFTHNSGWAKRNTILELAFPPVKDACGLSESKASLRLIPNPCIGYAAWLGVFRRPSLHTPQPPSIRSKKAKGPLYGTQNMDRRGFQVRTSPTLQYVALIVNYHDFYEWFISRTNDHLCDSNPPMPSFEHGWFPYNAARIRSNSSQAAARESGGDSSSLFFMQ